MTFKVGDRIFTVRTGTKRIRIKCPDCLGEKKLKVTLADGSEVFVDCGCGHGLERPAGYYEEYVTRPEVKERVVTGLSIEKTNERETVTYRCDGTENSWISVDESDAFASHAEAVEALKKVEKENEDYVLKKIAWAKEDNRRTWAWHVRYHRECLARAKKDAAYHEIKLAQAKEK